MSNYQFKMYDTHNPKNTKIIHYEVSGEKNIEEMFENFKLFLLACDFILGDDVRIGLIDTKAEEIELKLSAFVPYINTESGIVMCQCQPNMGNECQCQPK